MSEDQDAEDKTQEASEQRIEQALERGDVAKSQELNGFLTLAASSIAAIMSFGLMAQPTAMRLAAMMSNGLRSPINEGRAAVLALESASTVLTVLAGPFIAVMLAAILGNLAMHRPLFTTEPLMPKFNRINPQAAAKRTFGLDNLLQFAKTLAKLTIVSVALLVVIWPDRDRLRHLAQLSDIALILPAASAIIGRLLTTVLLIYGFVAVADAVYQRFAWRKRHRMTLQEVKEEYKQSEGSPEIKARIRHIRNQRVRRRMMAAVPKASVIITNPTHYAVALQFEKGMAAPVCLAKGIDDIALKIREIAAEHRIPIVENPPLARALHATVDVDDEIPAEHYKAVAEVIGYVLRLKSRRR